MNTPFSSFVPALIGTAALAACATDAEPPMAEPALGSPPVYLALLEEGAIPGPAVRRTGIFSIDAQGCLTVTLEDEAQAFLPIFATDVAMTGAGRIITIFLDGEPISFGAPMVFAASSLSVVPTNEPVPARCDLPKLTVLEILTEDGEPVPGAM